jgi:hypothetical protein
VPSSFFVPKTVKSIYEILLEREEYLFKGKRKEEVPL